ncbi:MepB family protein [Flammeovirgaceae bacterium SG7u.111]|nr:MepB family protein [Flammeovirgaceae bacterium SG7u.132]WPO37797.1 MepB family protein [Flammeovirgaceae bacterium SG7u.111]
MNRIETLDKNLAEIVSKIYDKCSLKIYKLNIESEGKEYDACQFALNEKKIICRSSKITPKKNGQFVTFWKRSEEGITEPFCETDLIDFFVINTKTENRFGQFVFPKTELINRGIISTKMKDGKRGFRVYPKWDKPQNKQAEKTQKWQLNYFFEIEKETDLKNVINLYKLN